MPRRAKTVGEQMVRTIGWGRATRALALVALWSVYRALHDGEDPTIQQLAEECERPAVTLYRWHDDFRRALAPTFNTPGELLDHARVRRDQVVSERRVSSMAWSP